MKRAGALSIALGAIFAAGLARGEDPPVTLEELERLALAHNPTLGQAESEVEAALGRARQAGLLPRPVVGYSAEEFAFRGGAGRGKQGVFLEQSVPLGKLAASRAIFLDEGSEADAGVQTQRLRILTSVRALYVEAVAAALRVRVRERLARLTEEAVTVSAQLYNTGAADRPDVLETEIESREAKLSLATARDEQEHTWLSLAAMVGRPDMPLRPLAGELDPAPPSLDRAQALAALLSQSPQLTRARARAERAGAVLARAERESLPDLVLRLGADYDRERIGGSGSPLRPVGWEGSFEAGVSLPLFNRNQGDRAAARAELSRAKAEVQRVELALQSRFSGVFEAYLTASRTAAEYGREIVPRAEEAHRLYLQKFQAMAAAYPQVLIAQRKLLQVTERYLSALESAHVAAVQIQGMLLVDGLDAPPAPGEHDAGTRASELPGAVRSGELPISVQPEGPR